MSQYSEQDLRHASEFREGIHREALEIVRKTRPHITEVVDRHPVEDYFEEHWDYPGRWYTMVSVPRGCGGRKALIDTIVRDTLAADGPVKQREPGRQKLPKQLDAKPSGYRELFTVDVDQESRSTRAVGTDDEGRHVLEHYEEYNIGSAVGSVGTYYLLTDTEYKRYARLALVNGRLSEADYERLTASPENVRQISPEQGTDAFFALLAEYPDLAVEYCIVKQEGRYLGYESHRTALKTAWRTHYSTDEDGEPLQGNPVFATGKRITVDELFSSDDRGGGLNYRQAFLYPPYAKGYTGKDFVRVNASLFPKGTEGLEAYTWSTDWSEYFDDGHEWWGALCLTVYDASLGRYAVIMASATD